MSHRKLFNDIEKDLSLRPQRMDERHGDEVYAHVAAECFKPMCMAMHTRLRSPVMSLFAVDECSAKGVFTLYCAFQAPIYKKWIFVTTHVPQDKPCFESLSKDIYSAALFEREIHESFGIIPLNSPDIRRLRLHDEVWPEGAYPMRKDFDPTKITGEPKGVFKLKNVEGEGVFEVAVGPVHAGIIAPGHFRFSVAGEPIINLEIRLGYTHRGIEKLFEGKTWEEAVLLSECVCGDSAFAHSMAFCHSIEKITNIIVPDNICRLRATFLELERLYNHINDIGAIALDVGFSFPAAFASIMKESCLQLNETLSGSRYLKGINTAGGILCGFSAANKQVLMERLVTLKKDLSELKGMMLSSVSFMDRADGAGVLRKKTAQDLGVLGVAGRASGIVNDLRKDLPGIYGQVKFKSIHYISGDVSARLNVRFGECEESFSIMDQFLQAIQPLEALPPPAAAAAEGCALGYVESWRGPVLYWVKLEANGRIERCKIVDPSFRNWEGLAFAMPGNIIPDFPVCNKSFNLSYPGSDL